MVDLKDWIMKVGALQDMEYATLVRVPNGPERSKLMSRVLSLKRVLWLGGETQKTLVSMSDLGWRNCVLSGGIMLSNTPDRVPSEVFTGHFQCQK